MTKIFIVYGSETLLLKSIFKFKNSYFIRIYNNRIPKKLINASDVKTFEEFKIIFTQTIKRLNPVKIIFIGAAFVTQNKLFFQENNENINNLINVNILNYIKYCHFILPFMINLKCGQFIYLSSFRSKNTARGMSLYASSKAFGEKFFEILGKENGIFGVYSTSIRLGYFNGRMIYGIDDEKIKKYKLSIGNRRFGKEEDLLNCINYILKNPFTNGGTIDLTGGISFN